MITTLDMRTIAGIKRATIDATPLAARNDDKRIVHGEIVQRINLLFAYGISVRAESRFEKTERIEKLLRTAAVRRDIEKDDDADE